MCDGLVSGTTLLDRILHWSEKQPSAPAYASDTIVVTYEELIRRAADVSAIARRAGGPVVIVSPVGLLSALGALGAALVGRPYLWVDPEEPPTRIESLVDRVQGAVVIVEADRKLDWLEETAHAEVLSVGGMRLRIYWTRWFASRPPGESNSFSGALYFAVTSGSASSPKISAISHENMLNLVQHFRAIGWQERRRHAWHARVMFDVSQFEFWCCLSTGGTLVPLSNLPPDPFVFVDKLTERRIEAAYIPPAFVEPVFDVVANSSEIPRLASLLIGVEPIGISAVAALKRARPALLIVNGYGPSEATVCCTTYSVTGQEDHPGRRVPIGRAVANSNISLDVSGTGEIAGVGEIVVSGACVGLGYVGGDQGGFGAAGRGTPERAFRTGDRARLLPDGNLEFVGRTDRQVKVAGHRLDLAELEVEIGLLDGVRQAVVLVVASGMSLVAVIQLHASEPASIHDRVRDDLAERLPAYAVPTRLEFVTALPYTRSGKVDRALLQEQHGLTEMSSVVLDRPSDAWRIVLSRERLPDEATFSQLGGSSAMAIRVVELCRSRLDLCLTVGQVLASSSWRAFDTTRPAESEGPRSPGRVSDDQLGVWLTQRARSGLQAEILFATVEGRSSAIVCTRRIRSLLDCVPHLNSSLVTGGGRPRIDDAPPTEAWEPVVRVDSSQDLIQSLGAAWMDCAARGREPVVRFGIQIMATRTLFAMMYNHVVLDGRAARILLEGLSDGHNIETEARLEAPRGRPVDESVVARYTSEWQTRDASPPYQSGSRRETIRARIRFDPEEFGEIRALASSLDLTDQGLLVAAMSFALHREFDQQPIVLAIPMSTVDASDDFYPLDFSLEMRCVRSQGDSGMAYDDHARVIQQELALSLRPNAPSLVHIARAAPEVLRASLLAGITLVDVPDVVIGGAQASVAFDGPSRFPVELQGVRQLDGGLVIDCVTSVTELPKLADRLLPDIVRYATGNL